MGWAGEGGTTHLAFGEVAGAEGSFYPLAVSRKHLEKTKGAEKGTRQREGSGLAREGFGELGGSVGRIREDSLLHRNLPFRVQLHLELHQAGGTEGSLSGPGLAHSAPQPKARQAGTHILSRKVLREVLDVRGCLTRASTSSAQSCRPPEHSHQAC